MRVTYGTLKYSPVQNISNIQKEIREKRLTIKRDIILNMRK
jgi:hypothetical protein